MTDTLTTYNPGNQFRHSSSWSPARKHPISGKVIRHAGEDWAATTGTPIVAAAAGKIAASGEGNGYGKIFVEMVKDKYPVVIADKVRFTAIGFWEKMGFTDNNDGNWIYRNPKY